MSCNHLKRNIAILGILGALILAVIAFDKCMCKNAQPSSVNNHETLSDHASYSHAGDSSPKLTAQQRTVRAKDMALKRHVGPGSRADTGYRTAHLKKSKNGCWPVPEKLKKELADINLYYYESIQQPHDNTCGSRSLANALAIRDALESKSLDPKIVKQKAGRYNWMHTSDNLTNVDIIEKAQRQNLENFYIVDYLTQDLVKRNRKKANPFTIISSSDHDEMVCGDNEVRINQEVIEKIRSNDTITAHFTCFLEPTDEDNIAHAVLVSLIKQKGKRPSMIYMDSCNVPLQQEWQAAAYMSYLYWQCIAV